MSAEVGSKAPEFTLTNQDRQQVSLGATHGKTVVLAFFPAAFTSVCQKELCHFRDELGSLNSAERHGLRNQRRYAVHVEGVRHRTR
jgi:peroxiredoxin